MNQPTKSFLCDTNSTTPQMNEDRFNKNPSGNSVTRTFCSCSHIALLVNDQGIWITEQEKVGGRGKCYIALLTNCCPYLGTLWAKLQSLKGNKDERKRTMTVWGQMLTQCSSQPNELARLYFWPHHKSGWNSTQQVTSNLSEINTDFRSIRYSGLRNKTRNAQGSIYKMKTQIHTQTCTPPQCFTWSIYFAFIWNISEQ